MQGKEEYKFEGGECKLDARTSTNAQTKHAHAPNWLSTPAPGTPRMEAWARGPPESLSTGQACEKKEQAR